MHDLLITALAGVAGVSLGAVFFGGLWWTVERGLPSAHPALWFLASLLLRTGVVLGGFYLVGHAHWERLLACGVGFMLARVGLTRWIVRGAGNDRSHFPEAGHAP